MANCKSNSDTDLTTTFAAYLRREAPTCFLEMDQAQVSTEFVGKSMRPASIIYRYRISDRRNKKHVLIKVPLKRKKKAPTLNGDHPDRAWRPQLVSKTDIDVKFQLEYEALSLIQTLFQRLDDARFDVIRVLDFLPDYRAIVMEESQNPSLRDLFIKASRLHISRASRELGTAFRNAGAWLNAYHSLPARKHIESRQTERSEIVDAMREFADYLISAIGQRPFLENVALRAITAVDETFPDTLPLGLGHGDFAMRNILVGSDMRVAVFDTLAKWQTPIYEDIAYFLVGLKLAWPQVLSQGLLFSRAKLADYENDFLRGYFGLNPIPFKEIRLYQLLMLMDRWSNLVFDTAPASMNIKGLSWQILINRYYHQCAQQLLNEIDVSTARSANMAAA